MRFGEAIEAMKAGERVSRSGWNGKRQYIELATAISYMNTRGEVINCEHEAIGNKAIAFVGTSGVQMGWLASQSDMLADDWVVRKEEPAGEPYAKGIYDEEAARELEKLIAANDVRGEASGTDGDGRPQWIRVLSQRGGQTSFKCSGCGRTVFYAGKKCPGCWQEMNERMSDKVEVTA